MLRIQQLESSAAARHRLADVFGRSLASLKELPDSRSDLVKVREETDMFASFNREQFRSWNSIGQTFGLCERHGLVRDTMHHQHRDRNPFQGIAESLARLDDIVLSPGQPLSHPSHRRLRTARSARANGAQQRRHEK